MRTMEFLVSYDVNTETREGERRLRRVAKVCEGFGQRVQKSVFECILDDAGLEKMLTALREPILITEDSVRIYRLREPRASHLWVLGRPLEHDLHDPLII